MNNLIITHPGTAHFDEFFATSLVLAVNDDVTYTIERRHPTEEELANPEIWVIELFEQNPGEIYPLMRSFGQSVIRGAKILFSQFEFWANSEKCIVKNKTGFIAKTKQRIPVNEVMKLVETAIAD